MIRQALLALLLCAAIPAVAQDIEEDPSILPEGSVRDDIFYLCTSCHSSRLVRNQALSRERWDDTLTWMTEQHGMPALDSELRTLFLDYLTAHFGPTGREPGRSPFLVLPERRNPFVKG